MVSSSKKQKINKYTKLQKSSTIFVLLSFKLFIIYVYKIKIKLKYFLKCFYRTKLLTTIVSKHLNLHYNVLSIVMF
jgi:hypothetical protein